MCKAGTIELLTGSLQMCRSSEDLVLLQACHWNRLLSAPKKPSSAQMTHILSRSLCQPSWGGKHSQIWRKYEQTVEGQYQFGFAFNLECKLNEPKSLGQRQLCGTYLSLGIIIIILQVQKLLLGSFWPKMGNTASLLRRLQLDACVFLTDKGKLNRFPPQKTFPVHQVVRIS